MLVEKYIVVGINYPNDYVNYINDTNKGNYSDNNTILNINLQMNCIHTSTINIINIEPFRCKEKAKKYIEDIDIGFIALNNKDDIQYFTINTIYVNTYDLKEIRYYKLKKIKENINANKYN